MDLGYPLSVLRQAGLVNAAGYDTYIHRIVFPLEGNLYGRSIGDAAPPTGFCPGAKAACIAGSESGGARRSFWWRVCLTTPCYGRRDFAMSPARWETISTHASFSSCATAADRLSGF